MIQSAQTVNIIQNWCSGTCSTKKIQLSLSWLHWALVIPDNQNHMDPITRDVIRTMNEALDVKWEETVIRLGKFSHSSKNWYSYKWNTNESSAAETRNLSLSKVRFLHMWIDVCLLVFVPDIGPACRWLGVEQKGSFVFLTSLGRQQARGQCQHRGHQSGFVNFLHTAGQLLSPLNADVSWGSLGVEMDYKKINRGSGPGPSVS